MDNIIRLKSNNPKNYVVAKLMDGTMFVHDKKSNKNFFSQKSIAKLCGLGQDVVSRHLSRYKALTTNMHNIHIALNVFNSDKPVKFYSFNALTYVAYRSNKPEAIAYRDYIEEALNEKFNKDMGFKQVKSLEQEAMRTIKYLENKVWEETKLAFESTKHEDFIYHMDLADKYAMDSQKRRYQLRNEQNCSKRLKKECELNLKGFLTESCELQVFLPDSQSTLIDFKLQIKEVKE